MFVHQKKQLKHYKPQFFQTETQTETRTETRTETQTETRTETQTETETETDSLPSSPCRLESISDG
jgi:hypothetical protein